MSKWYGSTRLQASAASSRSSSRGAMKAGRAGGQSPPQTPAGRSGSPAVMKPSPQQRTGSAGSGLYVDFAAELDRRESQGRAAAGEVRAQPLSRPPLAPSL